MRSRIQLHVQDCGTVHISVDEVILAIYTMQMISYGRYPPQLITLTLICRIHKFCTVFLQLLFHILTLKTSISAWVILHMQIPALQVCHRLVPIRAAFQKRVLCDLRPLNLKNRFSVGDADYTMQLMSRGFDVDVVFLLIVCSSLIAENNQL